MEIRISQGEPKSPYFLLAYPKREYESPRGKEGSGTIVILTNEKAKTQTKAEYCGAYQVPVKDFETCNMLCKLAYGQDASVVLKSLAEKYPELNEPDAIIEYLILKKI